MKESRTVYVYAPILQSHNNKTKLPHNAKIIMRTPHYTTVLAESQCCAFNVIGMKRLKDRTRFRTVQGELIFVRNGNWSFSERLL